MKRNFYLTYLGVWGSKNSCLFFEGFNKCINLGWELSCRQDRDQPRQTPWRLTIHSSLILLKNTQGWFLLPRLRSQSHKKSSSVDTVNDSQETECRADLGISVMFKFEEQSYSWVQIAMKLLPTDGQFLEVQTINWSNSTQQATLRKERLRATDCFGEIFANWIWDIKQCTQKHLLGKQCKTSFRW